MRLDYCFLQYTSIGTHQPWQKTFLLRAQFVPPQCEVSPHWEIVFYQALILVICYKLSTNSDYFYFGLTKKSLASNFIPAVACLEVQAIGFKDVNPWVIPFFKGKSINWHSNLPLMSQIIWQILRMLWR